MASRILTRPAIRRGSILEFFGNDPTIKLAVSLDGNVRDESRNGNHGTLVGGMSYGVGKIGLAGRFDGIDDRVNLGTAALTTGATTVMYFYRHFDALVESYFTFDLKIGRATGMIGLSLGIWQGFLHRGAGGIWVFANSGSIVTVQWHHVAMVYDGVDPAALSSHKICVDGQPNVVTSDAPQGIGWSANTIGSDSALIACYKGWINNFGVFSRGLSLAEISQYCQWATATPRKYWFYSPTVAGVYMDSYFYRHLMAGGR